MGRNCLVLSQYREGDIYNDFIGKFYHFPVNSNKNYLSQFDNLPIEFVYYEPSKKKGEFFGYGKIVKPPFPDKRDKGFYFVEIEDYKVFSKPVYFKDQNNEIKEQTYFPNSYNPQNAVRKTNSEFIDEICLDGGVLLNFQADAHLVQVLGEQLIASERVGILELIKNSFDAGASYSRVRIEKIPELISIPTSNYLFNEYEGPVIVIEDNGSGMNKEQIESGWLRPASTIKTSLKEKIKQERERAIKENKLEIYDKYLEIIKAENKGRIPLGEKGVGRFACHRLGKNLIIKTKVIENEYEYVLP